MPAAQRLRATGVRIGDRVRAEMADAARALRRESGVSQQHLASAAGVSRAFVQRLESGRADRLDLLRSAVVFACLGHRVSVRLYPDGTPLRDAGHLRLLARFEARVGRAWVIRREVPVAEGDARAWDLVLRGPVRIGVEAETRITDLQALQRRLALRRRDGRMDRVILLVASTHANRIVIHEHLPTLRSDVPLDTRSVLSALAAGLDPGGDGLVVL